MYEVSSSEKIEMIKECYMAGVMPEEFNANFVYDVDDAQSVQKYGLTYAQDRAIHNIYVGFDIENLYDNL